MAKKSGLPWMPMYVDNFIAACVAWGLSLEQEGAYNRLLLCTWNRKEPIPFDEREIAKVLGCTRHRWRTKLWPKLASFFDVSDGTLRQKKLEEVIEGAKNSRKNSENFDENEADS